MATRKTGRPPALSNQQAEEIREIRRTQRLSYEKIARLYDVSFATIERVIKMKYPYDGTYVDNSDLS